MDDEILLKTFRQLGFSEYEARCYLALFSKSSLTVSEVAKLNGVPRPNTYDALDKLMKNGFIMAVPGRTKRYTISDPGLIKIKSYEPAIRSLETEIADLDNKRKEKADTKAFLKNNVDNIIKHLDGLFKKNRGNNEPLNYIEIIKDPVQIVRRLNETMNGAKEEVLTIEKTLTDLPLKAPRLYFNLANESAAIIERLTKRGVVFKAIYDLSTDINSREQQISVRKKIAAAGEKIRIIKKAPTRMAIIDSKIIFFSLKDPVSEKMTFTTQIITHQEMAMALKMLFETVWAQAEDFDVFLENENKRRRDKL